MNKVKALNLMEEKLKDFKYIYRRINTRLDLWNLIFDMDVGLPEIQMTIEFTDKYLEILAFPHPRIVTEKNFEDMLKIVNHINWNVKGIGRFYLDDYDDLAYSIRIQYEVLENITNFAITEIELTIDLYSDLLKVIYDVSIHKINSTEGIKEIDLMWNRKHK